MRGLVFGIVGLLLLASPGICQLDTFELVEIGSIEAPGEIVELYVEDLDGDSLKEIILTTPLNIHIYNGITYEEIWTSPELPGLINVRLADYNNDELIDASVRIEWSGELYVYDPHDSSTIVSITDLEYPIYCHTSGDRNDDRFQDIIISTHYSFPAGPGWDGYDSTWTHIYDGPDFQLVHTTDPIITLRREWFESNPPVNIDVNQDPSSVILVDLVTDQDPRDTVIMVHMNSKDEIYSSLSYDGYSIWYDGLTFDSIKTSTGGSELQSKVLWYQGIKFDYVLTGASYHTDFFHYEADFLHYYSISFSGTLLLYDEAEPINSNRSYLIDDIASSYEYHECIFSHRGDWDFILYSIFTSEIIWDQYYHRLGPALFKLTSPTLFDHPQICFDNYVGLNRFLDSEDGEMTGQVYMDVHRNISGDANNDGTDEIYSIQGNQLIISDVQLLTGIQDDNVDLPNNISFRNYPNPFNSTTTIEYGLPEQGHVTIEIYDLLGRKVETLVDEQQEAGTYQVVWDAGDRSSGVYFYRLTAANLAETKRMVLLK